MCDYSHLDIDLDIANICRDEKCDNDDIHPAHAPLRRVRHRQVFTVSRRGLIMEAVYAAVSDRVLRRFSEIYNLVVEDYGSCKSRTVHRAIAALIENRQIIVVAPSQSVEKVRTGRFVRGGYVRYDSPLLWEPDGLATLVEQADAIREEIGFSRDANATRWANHRPVLSPIVAFN
jgi:hypothetical protein